VRWVITAAWIAVVDEIIHGYKARATDGSMQYLGIDYFINIILNASYAVTCRTGFNREKYEGLPSQGQLGINTEIKRRR